MEIKSYPNGIYGATSYLVYDEESKEGVLIDCTSSVENIAVEIKSKNINLKYILITHGHFDHVYCLKKMKEKFPSALIMMNKNDMPLLNQVQSQCMMAGVEEIKTPCIDGLLDENTKNLMIGKDNIKVIETKGHSKGGVCYLIGDNLFSGDTLFKDSIGRCDLFGGDYKEIENSIKNKLFKLDENITVYPGHGDKSSISYEKKYNSYFGSMT